MYICQLVWKKINQEITVVYNQFLYWHQQKKNKKPSYHEEFLKKNWNYKSLPEPTLWNEKSKKKVTHTYTSLSLVSKECKRLLWFPTIVYEVRKINEIKNYTNCCFIFIATIHFSIKRRKYVPDLSRPQKFGKTFYFSFEIIAMSKHSWVNSWRKLALYEIISFLLVQLILS